MKDRNLDKTRLKIYYVMSPKELKSFWIIAPSKEFAHKIVESYELISEPSPEIHCFSDFILTQLSDSFDSLTSGFTKETQDAIKSYKKEIKQNNYDIYQKYQNLPAILHKYLDEQDRDAATIVFHILDSTNAPGRITLQQLPTLLSKRNIIPFIAFFTPILNPLNTSMLHFNQGEALINSINIFIDKIKDQNRTLILNSVKVPIYKLEDIKSLSLQEHNTDDLDTIDAQSIQDDYDTLPF